MSTQQNFFENFDMSQLNPNYMPPSGQEPAADEGVPPGAARIELPCIVCHKCYVCKKFLQRHKTFHHHLCKQVQQLDCDHCGAIFADVDSHRKHLEETDSHLKEYFSVGLPQKIKQKQRAINLNKLRKKTLLMKQEDEHELKDFFLQNFGGQNPELDPEPAPKKKNLSNSPDSAI